MSFHQINSFWANQCFSTKLIHFDMITYDADSEDNFPADDYAVANIDDADLE